MPSGRYPVLGKNLHPFGDRANDPVCSTIRPPNLNRKGIPGICDSSLSSDDVQMFCAKPPIDVSASGRGQTIIPCSSMSSQTSRAASQNSAGKRFLAPTTHHPTTPSQTPGADPARPDVACSLGPQASREKARMPQPVAGEEWPVGVWGAAAPRGFFTRGSRRS
jgi:hypothetical protein